MFRLKNISLFQFKNYRQESFSLHDRVIAICGSNGVGKTNLLDAIYYLCFTKSHFAKSDQQHVHNGAAGFSIRGEFELNGKQELVNCILRENGKKEFSVNDELYEKFSAHIGKFPCVIITPDDAQIITNGSEERRRFIDTLICQLDAAYLQNLMDYNKIMLQRNSFLKSLAERKNKDYGLLDVYDEQLVKPGNDIFSKRKSFLEQFLPQVKDLYSQIAGSPEQVELVYLSQLLDGDFMQLLKINRERDQLLQRTNAGIHKDDIDITLSGRSFKTSASQGQRKSLLFAMKLSEFETLKMDKGFPPLLLLDDVFEKLDESRMYNLLDRVCLRNNGQLFISDTHGERISRHFEKMGVAFQMICPGVSNVT